MQNCFGSRSLIPIPYNNLPFEHQINKSTQQKGINKIGMRKLKDLQIGKNGDHRTNDPGK